MFMLAKELFRESFYGPAAALAGGGFFLGKAGCCGLSGLGGGANCLGIRLAQPYPDAPRPGGKSVHNKALSRNHKDGNRCRCSYR